MSDTPTRERLIEAGLVRPETPGEAAARAVGATPHTAIGAGVRLDAFARAAAERQIQSPERDVCFVVVDWT